MASGSGKPELLPSPAWAVSKLVPSEADIPVFEIATHGQFNLTQMIKDGYGIPRVIPEGCHLLAELTDICELYRFMPSNKHYKTMFKEPAFWQKTGELNKGENMTNVFTTMYAKESQKKENAFWSTIQNTSRYYTDQSYFPRILTLDDIPPLNNILKGFFIQKHTSKGSSYIYDIMERLRKTPMYLDALIEELLDTDPDARRNGAIFIVTTCGELVSSYQKTTIPNEEISLQYLILNYQRAAKLQPVPTPGQIPALEDYLSVHSLQSSYRSPAVSLEDPKYKVRNSGTSTSRAAGSRKGYHQLYAVPQELEKEGRVYHLANQLNRATIGHVAQMSPPTPVVVPTNTGFLEIYQRIVESSASGRSTEKWAKHGNGNKAEAELYLQSLLASGVKGEDLALFYRGAPKGELQPIHTIFPHMKKVRNRRSTRKASRRNL